MVSRKSTLSWSLGDLSNQPLGCRTDGAINRCMGSVSATSGPDTEFKVPNEILQNFGMKTSFFKDVPKLPNRIVRANVSPKSIPSRCLNPRATNLDFALLIQSNSPDFQPNNHFASMTLPIGCYAGPNVLACSRPRNSRVLESRNIAACSDGSSSATVEGVGTTLARAVGRSASGGGSSCSRKASSNASWVVVPCAKAA